jgi:hypothetical protein
MKTSALSALASAALLSLGAPAASFAMAPRPLPPAPDAIEARAAAGRSILKRYSDSIVTIELVATVSMTVGQRSMPPRETKLEANGTLISAAGLAVTSLTLVDPRSAMGMLNLQMPGNKIQFGETEYKEVKIRLGNGTEIPASVVLKDADLDLAFIAPDTDGKPIAHTYSFVDLRDAAEPQILEDYYDVSRAPKSLQLTPRISISTVNGIVEKPRRLFIVSPERIGCPLFDARGRILGICVQHASPGARGPTPVVMPAADIADLAVQAVSRPAGDQAKGPASDAGK